MYQFTCIMLIHIGTLYNSLNISSRRQRQIPITLTLPVLPIQDFIHRRFLPRDREGDFCAFPWRPSCICISYDNASCWFQNSLCPSLKNEHLAPVKHDPYSVKFLYLYLVVLKMQHLFIYKPDFKWLNGGLLSSNIHNIIFCWNLLKQLECIIQSSSY